MKSAAGSSVTDDLLSIFRVRYYKFRERFGREPAPDEPLFFDPNVLRPAAPEEFRSQLIAAAQAVRVDAEPILALMGLH